LVFVHIRDKKVVGVFVRFSLRRYVRISCDFFYLPVPSLATKKSIP
jgi:hypothetical protein